MLRNLIFTFVLLCVSGVLTAATEPPAETPRGDPEAGRAAALVCSACHGSDGRGIGPEYPNLGGQHYNYLLSQMRAFHSGERQALLMMGQVEHLTEQQLKDISAFYADQPLAEGTADAAPEVLELGERIYRAGIANKGVAACIACHSPGGHGNGPAGYPSLSGQPERYTALQLKAYRDGERETDAGMGGVMRGVTQNMNDREIEAVSAYIRGLH